MRQTDANTFCPISSHAANRRVGAAPVIRAVGAVTLAALLSPGALARQSPGSFFLPEAVESPAPAPQGPADTVEGVAIEPRPIEPSSSEPRALDPRALDPSRTIPVPLETPSPVTEGDPETLLGRGRDPVPAPIEQGERRPVSAISPDPVPPTPSSSGPIVRPASAALPGGEEAAGSQASITDLRDASAGETMLAGMPAMTGSGAAGGAGTKMAPALDLLVHRPGPADWLFAFRQWIAALFGLLAALFVALAMARRRAARPLRALPAPPGNRQGAAAALPRLRPDPARDTGLQASEANGAAPPHSLPFAQRFDLRVDILSAARSILMFSLEYRVTVANRTERAERGLCLKAGLDCARPDSEAKRGGEEATGTEDEIARIGPGQAAMVTGRLEIPVADLHLIRRGGRAAFIPLIHCELARETGERARHAFLVGLRSEAGSARVRPIPIGSDIGGIRGLVAQKVSLPEGH